MFFCFARCRRATVFVLGGEIYCRQIATTIAMIAHDGMTDDL